MKKKKIFNLISLFTICGALFCGSLFTKTDAISTYAVVDRLRTDIAYNLLLSEYAFDIGQGDTVIYSNFNMYDLQGTNITKDFALPLLNITGMEYIEEDNDIQFFTLDGDNYHLQGYDLTCTITFNEFDVADFDYGIANYLDYSNYSAITSDSYNAGFNAGYNAGMSNGADIGYSNGYNDGYNDGVNVDSTTVAIFGGILSIAMVPINMFLSIFNFEIFGINMSSFVSALLTVCVIIIVIKMVSGKGKE